MNNTSLVELEKERLDSLKKYQLDDSSIAKFRKKIKPSEDAEALGKELYDTLSNIKSTFTDDILKQITKLIINGANPNYNGSKKGDFPLLVCARKGYLEAAYLLLRAGANVDRKNNYRTTALMAAARHGQVELVKILILLGADINIACKDGDTALISAKIHGQQECFDILVKAQAAINHKNYNDKSVLDINGNITFDASCMIDKTIIEVKNTTEEDVTKLLEEAQEEFNKLRNK